MHASAQVVAPGVTKHQAGDKLIVGEPDGAPSHRLTMIAELFADAGFEALQSTNIQRDIWYKLWGNMTMNPVSALCGAHATASSMTSSCLPSCSASWPRRRKSANKSVAEFQESGEDRIAIAHHLGAFKTSMLQDAEAGRPLEINQLLAAPQEIARLVGVSTPNLDALLGLTRLYAHGTLSARAKGHGR